MPADTRTPPAFRWVPDAPATNGDLAFRLGEQLGLTPDDDQRDILDAIFAEKPDGTPASFEVAAIAPRQNLKTATLELAALTDLFVFKEPLHIWTAHKFDTAEKTYEHMKGLIESHPHYRELVHFDNGRGDQAISLLDGGQAIEFHARAAGAGRGATGAKVTLDEALYLKPGDIGSLVPTLATVPTAQVRYGSSAGMEQSAVLRRIRDRGRVGGDLDLAYFEWCAPAADCEQPFCHHFVGTPGCVLDRMDLLRLANPALGRRISETRLANFRKAMPPEEFMREFLGWWEDPPNTEGGAVDAAAWLACLDRESRMGTGASALGVHLTGDRSTAYVVGVGSRSDDLAHVEILAEVRPTQVVAEVAALTERRPSPVVMFSGSHSDSLRPEFEAAGVPVLTISQQQFAAACGVVYDLITEKQVRHIGQAQMDAAVAGATVKPGARDAWLWKGPATTPLMAATLAVHGYGNQTSTGGWAVAL